MNHTRRVVVSYKWKYLHEVLVNRLFKLVQEKSMVRWTDRPAMTIADDLGRKATKTTKATYIVNNMDPDQTAPKGAVCSGFIVFASMIKSSLKCTWIYASDLKADSIFRTKNYHQVKGYTCWVWFGLNIFFLSFKLTCKTCIHTITIHRIPMEA